MGANEKPVALHHSALPRLSPARKPAEVLDSARKEALVPGTERRARLCRGPHAAALGAGTLYLHRRLRRADTARSRVGREPFLDLARVGPLVEDAVLDAEGALELAEEDGAVRLGLELRRARRRLVLGAEGAELGDAVGVGGGEGYAVSLGEVDDEGDAAG